MPGATPLTGATVAGVPAPGIPARTEVAVLGAGILGCLTALQCARHGLTVTLVEREAAIWQRASLHNEGKVHLGLVYAQGSPETRRALLQDALLFAPEIERALDAAVDWSALRTPGFRYIVMPDSQLDVAALALRFAEVDDAHCEAGRLAYLGEKVARLVDREPMIDEQSGLPCFSTAERAVDPVALRTLVLDQLEREPAIELLLSTTVTGVEQVDGGVRIGLGGDDAPTSMRARTVIDCRWEQQGSDVVGRVLAKRNVRIKAAVRLRTGTPVPTATLVSGPYGDLVQHHDYAYVSWYPDARVHHEFSTRPGPEAEAALARVASAPVIEAQLTALRSFGWLAGEVRVVEGVGGFILGEGPHDITRSDSRLHDRAAAGLDRHGDVLLPRSFKFSSAPAAAHRAARAAHAIVSGR